MAAARDGASVNPTLERLMEEVARAEGAVETELVRVYPKGTRIRFMIRSDQQNYSHGEVISHRGDRWGTLVVRMDGGHVTRVSQSQDVGIVR